MSAPRRVGLPYGSYPRLLLAYLTTAAVRTKSPHDPSRRYTQTIWLASWGCSTISGPRWHFAAAQEQLRRLLLQ